MPHAEHDDERRVLILAPTRKDGDVTQALLAKERIASRICFSLEELAREIEAGAGAVLLTDSVVKADGLPPLVEALDRQPSWSDLPIVMLVQAGGRSPAADRMLDSLRNVMLLERPAPVRTVVSAVRTALRARDRQYLVRMQVEALRSADASMRELQEQFEFAIDASQLGTFHCPAPLGKIVWNDRCKAHFWLPPEAEVDIDLFYSILHPEDRARTRAAVEACVNEGLPYDIEYRTVSPSGAVRWIRATGRTYCDESGSPVRFDGTTLDVTQRKLAEKALRETQERFEAMANAIPQLAWMARPDGTVFWYNRRWHDYCGTTPEEMESKGWSEVHDPAEFPRVQESWRTARQFGEPWEHTYKLRRYDGEFRWHLSRARPFRGDDGRILLWFGTNTDVTEERRRAEERLHLLESEQAARREAERLSRMKDEFLATLSHELRTPLNALFGWSQILTASKGDPKVVAEAAAVIDRNVRVQTQLIEDLLDMSRVISGKIRLDVGRVDVAAVVAAAVQVVQPAADAKGVQLVQAVDPSIGHLGGDAGRLQQVFWNLLANAVKFTPSGGVVRISAACHEGLVEVRVQDTGEGIDPEFLPHLFERFSQADGSTTRRFGGLGLGLSIVKSLVELHGGAVRAESEGKGRGSLFVIRLPRRVTATAEAASGRPREPGQVSYVEEAPHTLRGVKVLVVDDEPDARELVRRFLLGSEATPALAASAAEARTLLASFLPDVILSDIGMPGEDGYAFMRAAREAGVKAPAVALTAYARTEDRIRSMQAGFQAHLSKPVQPAELVALIASLHERFRAASAV